MKTNKSDSDFQLWTETPRTPTKKIINMEIPLGTPPWKSGHSCGTGVSFFLVNDFFFSKFLILPTGLPRRPLPPKIAARWRYRLLINNLTAHYNSQFFVSFHLCFNQTPHNASKRVWIGPKHECNSIQICMGVASYIDLI